MKKNHGMPCSIFSTIAIRNPQEEFALPLKGKKSKLTKKDLLQYWGKERLGLSDKSIESVYEQIKGSYQEWDNLIGNSFLSPTMKEKYNTLLEKRKLILV